MSVNCVYCGHVNPDGSTVCLSCGRTLPPAPSSPGSYGQQPQSWGSAPSNPPPAPAPSYPPANPYGGGGSYPPPDSGYGQGQPPSYGGQPSYDNQQQQQGYGANSYPPPAPPGPSYGQAGGQAWAPPGQPYGAVNPEAQTGKTMALIGLILGIISAIIGWCYCSGFLFGGAALILGFLAKSKLASAGSEDGRPLALWAIGLGILGICEALLYIIFIVLIIGVANLS